MVADAAAVACHWEYSPSKIAAAVGSGDPAFHSPSISPFYTVEAGLNRCAARVAVNQATYCAQLFAGLDYPVSPVTAGPDMPSMSQFW